MSTSAHPASATPCSCAPVVAVVNNDDTLIRIFRLMLDPRGFATVATNAERTEDLAAAAAQIEAFLARANPQAVVFDIPYPYTRHWALFQQVRQADAPRGRPVVLTSTHATLVRSWAAPGDATAILEVPFGTEELVQAVRAAVATSQEGKARMTEGEPKARNTGCPRR